jgi:integrase
MTLTDNARFQNGYLMLAKNKRAEDTWFFRYYEDRGDKRVYRKVRLGTISQFPRRKDAEKAALVLRGKINSEVRTPETVADLITHYTKHELTLDRKAFATIDGVQSYLKLHIGPKWGTLRLSDVKTVAVEKWLDGMTLAPGSRTKIRNIMSALFTHAIRHEWITFNPISKVRTSAKRLREPDVLSPIEFNALLRELGTRERAMIMLAGATGLRRSEMFALRWSDVSLVTMEVAVERSCVRGRIGDVKTQASRKPVPLHSAVAEGLAEWRRIAVYSDESDFVFASERLNGEKPLTPDMVLKKIIRPALAKAGITGKVIGWHSFRHSLATNLRSLGVDVKVAQELLRHANSRITMDIYTQAVSTDKRFAAGKHMDLLLASGGVGTQESSQIIPR